MNDHDSDKISQKQSNHQTRVFPLLPRNNLYAWPGSEEPEKVRYQPLGALLSGRYATDAHFVAYSTPEIPHRLDHGAVGHAELPQGVPMRLLIVDVDCPAAHKDGSETAREWRMEEQHPKIEKLNEAHPKLFSYDTRGGYRIVYQLPTPFLIKDSGSSFAWKRFYLRALCYLSRAFEIIGDPKCKDWQHLYRLPYATREGGGRKPENRHKVGDFENIGAWTYQPTPQTLEPDLDQAKHNAGLFPNWAKVPEDLIPPTPRPQSPQRNTASLEPYLQAALNDALEKVRTAPPGDRNATLNKEAFSIAGLGIDPELLREVFTDAGLDAGLTPEEVNATVEGAIKAGAAKPRTIPTPTPTPPKEEIPPTSSKPPGGSKEKTPPMQEEDPYKDIGLRLSKSEKGKVHSTPYNAGIILHLDPRWKGILAFSEFALRVITQRPPLWDEEFAPKVPSKDGAPWHDEDDFRLSVWLDHHWGVKLSPSQAADVVLNAALKNPIHPVKDYLQSCSHDGKPRFCNWLSVYFGAPDNPYTRAVGVKFLVSSVARVMEPGCKADCLPIFEGDQGAKKSQAMRILSKGWFTDRLSDLSNKDAALELQGVWLVELAEFDYLVKYETATLKKFFSRDIERFRAPYGRRVEDHPRQCIFAGTTNKEDYLKDETGARRYWPVKVGNIDLLALERDVDQLWAEAVLRYQAGEHWWLEGDLVELAKVEQDERYQSHPWEEVLAPYLASPRVCERDPKHVIMTELLTEVLKIDVEKWTQKTKNEVSQCLRRLGWVSRNVRTTGQASTTRGYVPSVPSIKTDTAQDTAQKSASDSKAVPRVPSVPSPISDSTHKETRAQGGDPGGSPQKSPGVSKTQKDAAHAAHAAHAAQDTVKTEHPVQKGSSRNSINGDGVTQSVESVESVANSKKSRGESNACDPGGTPVTTAEQFAEKREADGDIADPPREAFMDWSRAGHFDEEEAPF